MRLIALLIALLIATLCVGVTQAHKPGDKPGDKPNPGPEPDHSKKGTQVDLASQSMAWWVVNRLTNLTVGDQYSWKPDCERAATRLNQQTGGSYFYCQERRD